MISVKDGDGEYYEAAKHIQVYGVQKFTESVTQKTTVNYSYFLPNGGAEMSASAKERVYYVTKGSITVNGRDGESHRIDEGGCIFIPAGAEREMLINDGKPAEVLVFMVSL